MTLWIRIRIESIRIHNPAVKRKPRTDKENLKIQWTCEFSINAEKCAVVYCLLNLCQFGAKIMPSHFHLPAIKIGNSDHYKKELCAQFLRMKFLLTENLGLYCKNLIVFFIIIF
jgi:hypothetical protein